MVCIDNIAPSGISLIMANNEGGNCIEVAPGANANLLPEDIETVKDIAEAEIILMQLENPMETIAAVEKNAKPGTDGTYIIKNAVINEPLNKH